MKEVICNKCRLAISDSTNLCQNCGSKGVECLYLRNPDDKTLQNWINKGYQIVNKKPFIEKFNELDIQGFDYELQKPI